jgi:rRNA maturation endonuclease Nob1
MKLAKKEKIETLNADKTRIFKVEWHCEHCQRDVEFTHRFCPWCGVRFYNE